MHTVSVRVVDVNNDNVLSLAIKNRRFHVIRLLVQVSQYRYIVAHALRQMFYDFLKEKTRQNKKNFFYIFYSTDVTSAALCR